MSRDDRHAVAGAVLLVAGLLIIAFGIGLESAIVTASGAVGSIVGGFTLGWAVRGATPL